MARNSVTPLSPISLVAVVIAALLLYISGCLGRIIYLCVCGITTLFGIMTAVVCILAFCEKTQCVVRKKLSERSSLEQKSKELLEIQQNHAISSESHIPVPLVSRSVDHMISEIINMTIRDYIKSWYKDIVHEPGNMMYAVKEELWKVVERILFRLGNIDEVHFLTDNVVRIITYHLQNIHSSPLRLSAHLMNEELELHYLRNVSETLLFLLLPPEHSKCEILRHLLREIVATKVFYATINTLCDPDYINQKLLKYLQRQQAEMDRHSHPYSCAETYEDFIELINKSSDIEELKRMRYMIMSEVMQATTINNIKRAKGIDLDKESSPLTSTKGDLLQARNLRRYLNQLRYAKNQCEKRLRYLGGPDYLSTGGTAGVADDEKDSIPGRKVLTFNVIMESRPCREQFAKYLEKEESAYLLRFWELIQEMQCANANNSHRLGNEIFDMYTNIVSKYVKLPRNIVKGMEEFIMGNKGPESFWDAQDRVYKLLEERFYPSFIVSGIYHNMMAQSEDEMIDATEKENPDHSDSQVDKTPDGAEEASLSLTQSLASHTSCARIRLQNIEIRLHNKIQAFEALNSIPKADMKKLQILEKEIKELKLEKRELENHIERTDVWGEHLGEWKASIHTTQLVKEGDKIYPLFTIVVHLEGDTSPSSTIDKPTAWVVRRSVQDFLALRRKILPIAPWLKSMELPSPSKLKFKSTDEPVPRSCIFLVHTFLSILMVDEQISRNEALYVFLSPSPDHLKQAASPKKSPKFSLAQFFKSDNQSQVESSKDDDELIFLDEEDSKEDKKDSIAEPLYGLMEELFELKGVFKWMRRTLIVFVQVTFGKTINRQIRETVAWTLSEPMLLYYLQMFKDSMWPEDMPTQALPNRTAAEKLNTRLQAKEYLLKSIPQVLNNLIGQQNAKKGVSKAFEALQDIKLNKQLFYAILEQVLYELVNEVKEIPLELIPSGKS